MSLDIRGTPAPSSPIETGRSSPVNPRIKNRDDDVLAKKDKGYRRYASGVERVLSLFDTAVEGWADYISFLSRLLKALQLKPPGFTDIPHKSLVAKRLSQCLNQALPSGVHQKTLEVYTYIFSILGRDGLSIDLSLYLSGLAPLLSYAALSVKPGLLAIFETYILALRPQSLRPALKALILALLPGLEEEASEEFERTLRIIAALKAVVVGDEGTTAAQGDSSGNQYFWQCIFLASITSASRRPGALAYLTRNLPRLGSLQETKTANAGVVQSVGESEKERIRQAVDAVASPEPGLLIRCFCAGLHDVQLLTQRGYLDLLVTHLPLHSIVLREKVLPEDLDKLVAAASSVVARRDMSLNRRLWSWFLGPEPGADVSNGTDAVPVTPMSATTHESQSRYFEQYGLGPLVRGIKEMIEISPQGPTERARPLRICLSLMDRWEIGGIVVPQVFLLAMQSVWKYQSLLVARESKAEVLRSANMFFDGVESGLIWAKISELITQAYTAQKTNPSEAYNMLDLVFYITSNFNIREEEMQVVHIPLVSLTLLLQVQRFLQIQGDQLQEERKKVLRLSLRIVNKLLDLVPQRAFTTDRDQPLKRDSGDEFEIMRSNDIIHGVQQFYAQNQGNLDMQHPPLMPQMLGRALLQYTFDLVSSMLMDKSMKFHTEIDTALAILNTSIRKIPHESALRLESFWSTLTDGSSDDESVEQSSQPFSITAAKITAMETVFTASKSMSWIPEHIVRRLVPNLITHIWPNLSPARPKYNVEAVRSVWRLQAISPDSQLIESTLTTLMLADSSEANTSATNVESARQFATLWIHSPSTATVSQSRRGSLVGVSADEDSDSRAGNNLVLLERPLMLLLDALDDPNSALFVFVLHWLQSLPTLSTITNLLISKLSRLPCVGRALRSAENSQKQTTGTLSQSDDLGLCLYYLRLILHITELTGSNVWPSLVAPLVLPVDEGDSMMSNQVFLTKTCVKVLQARNSGKDGHAFLQYRLSHACISLIRQLLLGPSSALIMDMEVEESLLVELARAVEQGEHSLQVSLLEVVLAALRMRFAIHDFPQSPMQERIPQRDNVKHPSVSMLSISTDLQDRKAKPLILPMVPPRLLQCLKVGLTSPNSRPVLESWIIFLDQCLPLYGEGIFQILLPLVGCFCDTLDSVFKCVQGNFERGHIETSDVFESTTGLLLNGLEQSLATAHDRIMTDEVGSTPIKTSEQPQPGFFGNMVSGVFTADSNRSRSTTANNRLTVLLCFKDAIKVCFTIWSWGDLGIDSSSRDTSATASFNYTTLRLRNRTRRIFEHLFAAEALESLETLIELWQDFLLPESLSRPETIFDLLHVLESSRPKNAMPAIFNAMYSRTNPGVLDPVRKSTLTSTLSDTSLATFLVAYTRSLDDDAMDEIWSDCMTFLKDVLANPMPHRQTLARLLEFTAVLGEKVDSTHFGEQRKMRRELGDLFVRLLTATLTIRPMQFSVEGPSTPNPERLTAEPSSNRASFDSRGSLGPDGLVTVLATIAPNLAKVLIDSDRITSTASTISSQVIVPTFRSKLFPDNLNQRTLDLIVALASIPEASKSWKKDVAEAFNDPRFFATPSSLIRTGWMPLLRQWTLADKDRMPDLISRLNTPTTAGIMFGVGANSARLDADRKTQLNLRRIAFLILSAANDTFVVNLAGLQDRLIDLMIATSSSSPSSVTRAEIYMVIRALVLKTSSVHLASFWPAINSELYDAMSAAFPDKTGETQNVTCLLQASKLLETLLILRLEDFQMQEWLFITDTTDAVYRPTSLQSVALVDELAENLNSDTRNSSGDTIFGSTGNSDGEKPLLTLRLTKTVPTEDLMEKVLQPFFRQLSIHTFESTYSMKEPDTKACFDDLIMDLFDDSTLV